MSIFLKILREIGIALVILLVLLAATFFAFKEQIPYGKEIPKGSAYAVANRKEYSASSNNRLEGIEAVTITHETVSSQIVQAENEVRLQTGKYTPFGTISNESDLPTEKVGVTINIDSEVGSGTTSSNQAGDEQNSEIEYPVTDDAIKQIEEDQAEDPESAANRRFETAE